MNSTLFFILYSLFFILYSLFFIVKITKSKDFVTKNNEVLRIVDSIGLAKAKFPYTETQNPDKS